MENWANTSKPQVTLSRKILLYFQVSYKMRNLKFQKYFPSFPVLVTPWFSFVPAVYEVIPTRRDGADLYMEIYW